MKMKKLMFTVLIAALFGFLKSGMIFAQLEFIEPSSPNVTQDINEVITPVNDNPLREGTYLPVESPDGTQQIGIINQGKIQTFEQGELQTLQYIKNLINYFIGFLGFIGLILLIAAGFRVVTAGSDDEKYKDAASTFRKVALAIAGIGLSWFIVTMIFYVVTLIVS